MEAWLPDSRLLGLYTLNQEPDLGTFRPAASPRLAGQHGQVTILALFHERRLAVVGDPEVSTQNAANQRLDRYVTVDRTAVDGHGPRENGWLSPNR